MVTSADVLASPQKQLEARDNLLNQSKQVFEEVGSDVILTGSNQYGGADIFSDLDLWVINPDDKHADTVAERTALFHKIGDVLLVWERPRFAPLDGMHSILLYDASAPLPIELNVFQASTSTTQVTYAGYFEEPRYEDGEKEIFWGKYPWRQEDDDASVTAKTSHLLCVSYWTAKYLYRGDQAKLQWLATRYEQARAGYIPDLPRLTHEPSDIACPADYIRVVLDGISHATEEPHLRRAVERIADAALWVSNGTAVEAET